MTTVNTAFGDDTERLHGSDTKGQTEERQVWWTWVRSELGFMQEDNNCQGVQAESISVASQVPINSDPDQHSRRSDLSQNPTLLLPQSLKATLTMTQSLIRNLTLRLAFLIWLTLRLQDVHICLQPHNSCCVGGGGGDLVEPIVDLRRIGQLRGQH